MDPISCIICRTQIARPYSGARILSGTDINNRSLSREAACATCVSNYCVPCEDCRIGYVEESPSIDLRSDGRWLCDSCNTRRTTETAPVVRGLDHRSWKREVKGSGKGDIILSARGWSTEIECYTTNRKELAESFSKLDPSFGINRDGSLRDAGKSTNDGRVLQEGIEITTPILKGTIGEKYLIDLCGALNKNDNARVNLTCGTHIHIDMSDCKSNFIAVQKLFAFHWLYETVLMSFLPSTRRANQYCQSVKNGYSIKSIAAASSYDALISVWYKNKHVESRFNKKHTRYHGINLHSMFSEGHMEVRYHSGTTNPKKILHWAALHTRIVDLCAGITGNMPDIAILIQEGMTPLGRSRSLSRLTSQFFDLLDLKEETKTYFMNRQKKFKDQPDSAEVEFIEKDDPIIYEGTKPDKKKPVFTGETLRGFDTMPNPFRTTRSTEEILRAGMVFSIGTGGTNPRNETTLSEEANADEV